MIGTELDGRYRIDAELGVGGAGTVYRGVQLPLGRPVAIKVLHPALSHSLELRQRFEREARALAALSHPNIVAIVDSGLSGDAAYLVMDLLEGETLAHRLLAGPLALGAAASIVRELLLALSYVHASGVVHRDVKPANVFLEQTAPGEAPRVRLLDFGLAKFTAPEPSDPTVTRAGQVFGTPSYMAPEQIAGQPVDARVDVYATGIVLFEMLAGAPPFRGDGSETMRKHLMDDLPIAALPSEVASSSIVALLCRATAKSRAERFSSADDMLAALDAAMDGMSPAVGGDNPTLDAPLSAAAGPRGQDKLATHLDAQSPARSSAFRVVALLAVVISLGALGVAALATYVFVTAGHPKERHALEVALKLPPPKHAGRSPPERPHAAAPFGAGAPAAGSADPGTVPDREPVAPVAAAIAASTLAPSAAPPAVQPSSPPSPAPPASPFSDPHEPAPNPWATVPPELARLLPKVNAGRTIDRREIQSLHQFNAKHAADSRGHIVLGRGYVNRRWLKDAMGEYAIVFELGPDARGDARTLPDLVRLAAFGMADAERIITEAYADTAVPAITRALSLPSNPQAKGRLQRLRAELLLLRPAP